ncbi:CIC11C00000001092 [Sungouiella intermedia]|uniref:CIC11C00000001092 n=1 Tax=Sungouiella intermedia TaxID=45354 RepID=A0A1L0C497_9ASCO|nr:CIC11C00000001092 [[Candida] intermedia]
MVAPCLLPLLCLAPGGTDVPSTQYCMLPIGSEVDDYAFLMFLKLYYTSNVFRVICGSSQAAFEFYYVL